MSVPTNEPENQNGVRESLRKANRVQDSTSHLIFFLLFSSSEFLAEYFFSNLPKLALLASNHKCRHAQA